MGLSRESRGWIILAVFGALILWALAYATLASVAILTPAMVLNLTSGELTLFGVGLIFLAGAAYFYESGSSRKGRFGD
jgi:hypothetical protein